MAIVLRLPMKRNDLADLEDLVFLTDRADFFPFVDIAAEAERRMPLSRTERGHTT